HGARELDRVLLHPLRVGAGPDVLRLERARQGGDGLAVCVLEQHALAALELEEVAEVARVEEELLLRILLLPGSERDTVEPAREPFDDREELEWAKRLPDERVGAGRVRGDERAALGSGQQH